MTFINCCLIYMCATACVYPFIHIHAHKINKDEIKKKLYILLNVNKSKYTILSRATLFSRNAIPLTLYYIYNVVSVGLQAEFNHV